VSALCPHANRLLLSLGVKACQRVSPKYRDLSDVWVRTVADMAVVVAVKI
jgi:hypothetical protein